MPRLLTWVGPGLIGLGALLWLMGGFDAAAEAIRAGQRQAQDVLAGAIRALRGGEPGALMALLGVSFAYGVVHAAGPGHGKLLVSGFGVARRVRALPLGLLALAASLAQAAVAVILVYGALALLGLTRDRVLDFGEGAVTWFGNLLIAALGLYLALRGGRKAMGFWRAGQGQGDGAGHGHIGHGGHDDGHAHDHESHAHDHAHDHAHVHAHVHDAHCGHAHAPTMEDLDRLTGWRDGVALIAGIAMRPCSGALFLLILTWQLGIGGAGIAGAFAMGIGVAAVTIAAAVLSVVLRESLLAPLAGPRMARVLPVIEMSMGLVILGVALILLRG